MTTRHESIMVALTAALAAADAAVQRNAPLPDLTAGGKVIVLSDGKIVQTEAFLNPPMYEFTATPLVLVVEAGGTDAERDAAVDATVESLVAAAEAADLGAYVTAVRAQPPDTAPRELWGAQNIKGAQFGIEIDYWSDSPAG